MANTLGDWVADVTKDFNAKTPQCHLTSTYKGTYDQTMTSGIAAHRAGRSTNILQVFEVGTATMMFSKVPLFLSASFSTRQATNSIPKDYIPAVYGYYSTADGRMLSYPFNSSTTVLYLNLTKFKNAGLPTSRTSSAHLAWLKKAAKALKAAGETLPDDHFLDGLDPARELLHLAQRRVRHAQQRLWRHGRAPHGQLSAPSAPS